MKYFKHDSNAHSDAKLLRLRTRHGLQGTGLYFYCLELIASTVEKHNLTFQLEYDAELIAGLVNIPEADVAEIIDCIVELSLFERDENGVISCPKMAARTDEYTQKLLRSSAAAGVNSGHYPDNLPTNTERNPDIVGTNSGPSPEAAGRKSLLIKENKENRSNGSPNFVPPSLDEVKTLIAEKNYNVDPEAFLNHYESNGWKVGNNKMKSWPHAVASWNDRKNKDSQNPQPEWAGI